VQRPLGAPPGGPLAFPLQSIIQFEIQIENPAGYSLRILIVCDRQGCGNRSFFVRCWFETEVVLDASKNLAQVIVRDIFRVSGAEID
jgi:hypothetical protein